MAVEITIFQGIAVVIFASISVIATFYFQVARKLESRVEEVTIEKAWIVEEGLLRSLFISAATCTQKMFKLISEKVGEETMSRLLGAFTEQMSDIMRIMRMSQEAIGSIDEVTFPKEVVEAIRLGDEEKDRLFDLSFLGYALNELVPETISYEVDELIKAILCGVICGLLVPTLDFFLSQDLAEYLLLSWVVSGIIIATGYYYIKNGIMGVWTIRKLEKKIGRLKRANSIDDVRETIEGIVE